MDHEARPKTDPSLGGVHIDWQDRSAFLKLSPSALTCTAEKGFRSGRANVGVREGSWYFECVVLKGGGEGSSKGQPVTNHGEPPSFATMTTSEQGSHNKLGKSLPKGSGPGDGAHVRFGWARREATINGPCGMDAYSCAIRDSSGEVVTRARPKPYGVPFGTGDVVGCLIHLPGQDEFSNLTDPRAKEQARSDKKHLENDPLDPGRIVRKRYPLYYKGQHYFEMVEYPVAKEMENLSGKDDKDLPSDTLKFEELGVSALSTDPLSNHKASATPLPNGNTKLVPNSRATTKNTANGKAGKAVKKGRKVAANEVKEEDKEKLIPRIKGSKISFFLNGKPMTPDNRPAFQDLFNYLPLRQTEKEALARKAFEKGSTSDALMKQKENPHDDGTLGYYPFVSCFGGAKLRFNPGPEWEKPVKDEDWGLGQRVSPDGQAEPIIPRPINDRWAEFRAEEVFYDELDDETDLTNLRKFEEEKRREASSQSARRSTAKGNTKRSKAAATKQRAANKLPSSLANEMLLSREFSPGSSPAPESIVTGQTGSRASTPLAGQLENGNDSDSEIQVPMAATMETTMEIDLDAPIAPPHEEEASERAESLSGAI